MRTLLVAAAVAVGLTMMNPIPSFASVNGNGKAYNNYGNGNYTNVNGNGYNCPKNGNNHEVPEPATLAMMGAALGWIALKKRKA